MRHHTRRVPSKLWKQDLNCAIAKQMVEETYGNSCITHSVWERKLEKPLGQKLKTWTSQTYRTVSNILQKDLARTHSPLLDSQAF